MPFKIANPRDFWAGVMFIGLGALFAGIAYGYKLGTAARMGPGFFPFWLGLILVALGIGVALGGIRKPGSKVDKFHWMPILWVLGSICVFGLLFKATGMIIAGYLLVIGSSLGGDKFVLRDVLLLATGLVIFCALVFVAGLKLPIPLCPSLEFFEQFAMCRG
jgi:hypothetical protein